MATTIVPAFDGPILTTAEDVRRRAKRWLDEVQGDCDKASTVEDSEYYQGKVDAYTDVLKTLTDPEWNTKEVRGEPEVVRILAEYQMFGDMEGMEWAHLVLSAAKDQRFLDYTVLASVPTAWGIKVITFTVDVHPNALADPPMTHDEAKAWATAMLNEVVGDSDISVRAMGLV